MRLMNVQGLRLMMWRTEHQHLLTLLLQYHCLLLAALGIDLIINVSDASIETKARAVIAVINKKHSGTK